MPAKLDRGRPVRAEASCADEATRKRLAEGFAFVLSENGFTVDPAAPVALRLTFKPAELRVASVAAAVTSTSAMNTDARQAYVSTAVRVQFVNADGKVVWTGDSLTGTTNVGGQIGKAQAATEYGDAAGPLGTPATSGIEARYPAEVTKAQTSILPKLTRELFGCFPGRIEPEVLGFAADGRPVRLPPVLWPGADGVTEARLEDQK